MNQVAAQPFASLDPDLPSIAARAALEVDALIRSKDLGHTNLTRLADVMTSAFGGEPSNVGAATRFLDPVATDVMFRTWQDASPARLTSYDSLRSASLDLVKALRDTGSPHESEALENLKRFCLALSRHALATSYGPEDAIGTNSHKR